MSGVDKVNHVGELSRQPFSELVSGIGDLESDDSVVSQVFRFEYGTELPFPHRLHDLVIADQGPSFYFKDRAHKQLASLPSVKVPD